MIIRWRVDCAFKQVQMNLKQRIHPYTSLPARNFWKTAIADRNALEIEDLWQPKFPFSKQDVIITAGSCFAQHISNSLKAHDFNWLDAELAPEHLDASSASDSGYGIFSFRTGNIYTARLLKQWLSWALGTSEQSTEVIEEGGRYYDPFRPTIPRDGYTSSEELFEAREITFCAIRAAIKSADRFIFTLGLTEAWINKQTFTYPLCPGTIRGDFSDDLHLFHNCSYDEVVADLNYVFDEIRKRNRNIKFLLTVSPVPLTATASDAHVLAATTYSKSVLRAAAGILARTRDDVDYFPSYEMISAHPFGGRFFGNNRRSVTEQGVGFVMGNFLTSIGFLATPPPLPSTVSSLANQDATQGNEEDVICEEIILDTWNRHSSAISSVPPRIVLVGDSQMGKVAEALADLGIAFAGGGIMHASQWHDHEFLISEHMFFVPGNEESRGRWQETYERGFAGVAKPTIITNVGMQANNFVANLVHSYLKTIYGDKLPTEIPFSHITNYMFFARRRHADLCRQFVQSGCRVICISDPPVQLTGEEALFSYADKILLAALRDVGCEVFNAREWLQRIGKTGLDFKGEDKQHANSDYYRRLIVQVMEEFAL